MKKDNRSYEGYFQNGKYSVWGKVKFDKNTTYEGEF